MDEMDLLEEYQKFVDRLVNDPQVGYAVWCQPELVAEYERLKKL